MSSRLFSKMQYIHYWMDHKTKAAESAVIFNPFTGKRLKLDINNMYSCVPAHVHFMSAIFALWAWKLYGNIVDHIAWQADTFHLECVWKAITWLVDLQGVSEWAVAIGCHNLTFPNLHFNLKWSLQNVQ